MWPAATLFDSIHPRCLKLILAATSMKVEGESKTLRWMAIPILESRYLERKHTLSVKCSLFLFAFFEALGILAGDFETHKTFIKRQYKSCND